MSSNLISIVNTDFKGKTVKEVRAHFDKRGLCDDMLILFDDGDTRQIGATKEGSLVCVSSANVSHDPRAKASWVNNLVGFFNSFLNRLFDRFSPQGQELLGHVLAGLIAIPLFFLALSIVVIGIHLFGYYILEPLCRLIFG